MPASPSEPSCPEYKVICPSHGAVETGIADHVAASLIRDEHAGDCPRGQLEIVQEQPAHEPKARTALEMIREANEERHGHRDDPNACDGCGSFISDAAQRCPSCGVRITDGEVGHA